MKKSHMSLSNPPPQARGSSARLLPGGSVLQSTSNCQRRTPSQPVTGPSKSSSQTLVKIPGTGPGGGGPSRCGGCQPSTQSGVSTSHVSPHFTVRALGSPASIAARSKATALAKGGVEDGKSLSDRKYEPGIRPSFG